MPISLKCWSFSFWTNFLQSVSRGMSSTITTRGSSRTFQTFHQTPWWPLYILEEWNKDRLLVSTFDHQNTCFLQGRILKDGWNISKIVSRSMYDTLSPLQMRKGTCPTSTWDRQSSRLFTWRRNAPNSSTFSHTVELMTLEPINIPK